MSAGLRATYDKLVKSGMLQEELNPDGTPGDAPDMDEVRFSSEQNLHVYTKTSKAKCSWEISIEVCKRNPLGHGKC